MRRASRRPYPNVRAWLRGTGTTQRQLAKRLGVHESHLANVLCRTRNASLKLALKLSHLTNVPIESIAKDDPTSEASVK